ncbi:GGDEF domain-containing protein [Roseovarius spongiae]|uniref:GGDEF domain-containing protein n=1 Tax=Roseovarius spongiae TaxID=2320272 RepID=A0A3A8B7K2_9RHOB|nr:bifunctional diguanylate cyclase/phosphodiesterase [Roseovarius spongiae]RKF12859.1 GGDEF domain-containing protein [Roseovarius spongiae]
MKPWRNPFPPELGQHLRDGLLGPPALALLPAGVLAGFWIGGEAALIAVALGYPACLALARLRPPPAPATGEVEGRAGFAEAVAANLRVAVDSSRHTGCILFELDDHAELNARHGQAATDEMMQTLFARMQSVLRSRDVTCRLDPPLFAVSVAPVRRLNLGDGLHMAGRVQAALEEPLVLDGTTVYVSASAGLALDTQLRRRTGPALIEAAETALAEARRHGPSALRAYSPEMHAPPVLRDAAFADAACEALENGQIGPWFQPQISTDTGKVTGFEALARWNHPVRGMVSPAEFLPALEQASRLERLGEVILHGALGMVKSWDAAGIDAPTVGVNFAPDELRNPQLPERIEWELDRFGLAPERLTVEILETVVSTAPDDTVARNIAALSRLGCRIDLDDFGTGHASISSIRRFDVQRLKIDRSFVMKVDRDPEQQRMIATILLMAEQLGLDTLAEGVETAGEHAMLGQLGCGHVQGFGIARPMPPERTIDWVRAHLQKLDLPPRIGRRTG